MRKVIISKSNFLDIFLLSECNRECLPISYSSVEYFFFILSPQYEVFSVYNDTNEDMVGYALGLYEDTNFHLMSIGIIKKLRGRGLGNSLLDYIEESVNKDTKTISLYVHVENVPALNLYKKKGFKVKERLKDYYKGSLKNAKDYDAFYMHKKIKRENLNQNISKPVKSKH